MSLSNENGNGMVMPVGPMGGMNGGYANGFGDWSFWIIILFLFAFMGNGWGNGWGGNGGSAPVVQVDNSLQRGFDQQAVMGGITGLTNAVTNGFANAEISRCNAQANTLQSLNNIGMSLQNCCCENRAGLADLKYTVATEACADRSAISDALRDVIASNTANTQAILDKMCQQEIDALKSQNAQLQTQLNITALRESQTAQTAQVLADNAAQTATLRQALNPTPIPAYVVANPNGCNCGQVFSCAG